MKMQLKSFGLHRRGRPALAPRMRAVVALTSESV
jgi:hypothetical protein